MVTIEEALRIVEDQNISLKSETKPLENSLGYALATNTVSPFDVPEFDNSAMDGYALCGLYQEYQLVGEVAAGDSKEILMKDGKAVRIFTGAKVPQNTTAVMMQEKTTVKASTLFLDEMPKSGQNIRKKGGQLTEGQAVFEKGHVLNPPSLALMGSLGLESLDVFSKPRVNIITTGNELVKPGKSKTEGQIYESNSYAIAGALEQFGFKHHQKTQIQDDFEATKTGIKTALESCDVLIISGGISVGDYDFVKQSLEENGVNELFYKVFQKPGKPLYFGRKDNQFVFALPGNPASSLTCFYVYVLPLLQKFSGYETTGLPTYQFPIKHAYENRFGRPSFLKAAVIDGKVEILDGQGSSMIQSMAKGNALAFIDDGEVLKEGDLIKCKLIS
ncbi:molybdenum cofactor synthesis domain-containing protein [Flagellimonas halotolerans]|uniref:Molybdopterin molybdenumtransferase n=1 Tax=Flagellimonas halotolerans TaxID=3112164 RepID=A0ABU6ITW9_9FLAO|nr:MULTISPECIES: gephyrin-like molybdotransferase Glp [unclassified Allomuricauda]MEC3966596.1 gephyrin-like molybdotransferase Glp [Muricauda sp. SYSU M86414]MEC4266431.1 gephyrin-like molybdotransferase Glp [Muricauda sp. SYSU M84420]